ncbi:D-TA family PLP-dependent enzyme [Flavisolibacter ginsenosidimutans]|uniref:D-TA family PLP-dependent enzyme n=1 Tax=Flavisolibacter ginsenosidimutans TaxID=661481 RepID=A0A5B8UCN6_9BACT|nr:D-TA family PLP-dependent enzyme [Flavisolibacter ginsenosidimutans]QEC54411.1 D-TA family PLP-dependent enzyme [Flavisolibacter ginsenosidimutans]
MKRINNWYEIENVSKLDSPSLVVYPERVEQNIQTLVNAVGDASLLRPHIKTCKAKEPVMLMMKAGITKFKCATIAEAELLGLCGAKDVLLAYQPTEVKLQRFLQLQQLFPETEFSCLVDNLLSASLFSDTAKKNRITLSVFLDLNVGMNRTGTAPDEALTLFEKIAKLPRIRLKGLHAYDGHINEVDKEERREICERCFEPVEALRAELERKGYGFPLLIAGGSPTIKIHSMRRNTEVSPGTFIFWDWSYRETIPEQAFVPAALLVTRIISLPAKDKICIDLGHKSVASENALVKRVFFLNAPELQAVSHSEEHMVLAVKEGHSFKIGDVLYALPYHICPTVALYKLAVTSNKGRIEGEWEITARDRRISA